MTLLLALVTLAFADPLDDMPAEPVAPAPLEAASSIDLVAEARKRMLRGDYEGVRIVAEQVLARGDTDGRDARYLVAMSWEHGGDPAKALALYDALLTDHPDDADATFRRAETLGRLGRYDEALAALSALGSDRTGGDRVQIEVLRAIYQLEAGEKPKKPLMALDEVLTTAAPEDAPAYQAKARAYLVAMAVEDADAIAFEGSDRKKGRQLEQRAGLVAMANEQTVAVIHLEAPEHVLGSLIAVGHAHESFGQAMLDETSPKKLSDDQRAIYVAERAKKVETLWIKAARYYDRALEYAAAIGWEGPPADEVPALKDAVMQKIEGLTP